MSPRLQYNVEFGLIFVLCNGVSTDAPAALENGRHLGASRQHLGCTIGSAIARRRCPAVPPPRRSRIGSRLIAYWSSVLAEGDDPRWVTVFSARAPKSRSSVRRLKTAWRTREHRCGGGAACRREGKARGGLHRRREAGAVPETDFVRLSRGFVIRCLKFPSIVWSIRPQTNFSCMFDSSKYGIEDAS